ncbi:MAG: hypothetical protein ABR976_14465 [Terracidiphilus sp.]|jgi:hypothetical protein
MTDADHQKPSGEDTTANQPPPPVEPPRPVANQTVLYAAVVAVIGILAGVVIATVSLRQIRTTPPPIAAPQFVVSKELKDLGLAEASDFGIKGNLTTQWVNRPTYHLTIEPGDATLAAGFALAVSDPPRPFSMNIELKDRLGYVMCSRTILLRYEIKRPADLEQADSNRPSGNKPALKRASAKDAERKKAEQANFDRLETQEEQREKNNDIFQNQIGANGQVASISAQGDIPCAAEPYERVATWGFVPNFPTLDEQADLLSLHPGSKEASVRAASRKTRQRAAYKSPSKAFSFSLEGDDAVVDYDVAGGIFETRAGKTFVIDKAAGEGNTTSWQEYPAYFHYRCEQTTSSCTLARTGVSVMHAKLKR